ncbi:MAG TPA: protein-disulfide reductase DsbD domain-containing protein [Terriglobia bacterium]|nr:protein-disulfide reductase DsbD domain-containing protein [Terriglobia bacterium]
MGSHLDRPGSRRLTCLVFLLLPGCLRAASANPPHAKVTLISERASIQPGRSFPVGLRFQLEKHWHIYWLNPGDSGEPPRVRWELPRGFRAGPIHWPTPRRLVNASLVDYGYEEDVLLIIPLYPPPSVPAGRTATLRATVKWLVCSSICIPEQKRVELTLPYQNGPPKPDLRWRQLFLRTRERLPRRMPPGWSARVRSSGSEFILTVKAPNPPPNAVFFPLEPLQISNAAPQRATAGGGKLQLFLEKSDQLVKPAARLRGVLVIGGRKAFTVNAPVVSPEGSGKSLEERRHRK